MDEINCYIFFKKKIQENKFELKDKNQAYHEFHDQNIIYHI